MVIPKITFNHEHYEKIARIGVGAFGSVFKCLHKATGQVVAVKILSLEEYDDNIADVQQEISILRKACESAHVVGVYGSFVVESDLWIVMEFMNGGSILDLMKPGPLDEKYIAVIVREMLLGLDHLHKMDIIHRDIKAANVLMSHDGQIKLADFGVCGQLSATLTKRTSLVGTVSWMAPEVIQQSGYNTSVDIWSLGITAIEMAKGVPPYFGDEPFKIMFMIPRNEAPTLEGSFSKAFKEFISLCLQKDPTKRPTAQELLKHKFIKNAKKGTTILTELIDRYEMYKSTHNKTPTSTNSKDDQSVDSTNSSEYNESDEDENIKWVWKKESMKTLSKDKMLIGTLRKKSSKIPINKQESEDEHSTDEEESDAGSNVESDNKSETKSDDESEDKDNSMINDDSHQQESTNESQKSTDSESSLKDEDDGENESISTNSVGDINSENGDIENIDNIVIDQGLSGMPTSTENIIHVEEEQNLSWDFPVKSSTNSKSIESLQLVILPAIAKATELLSSGHNNISPSKNYQNSIENLRKSIQNLENDLPGFSLSLLQLLRGGKELETKPETQDFEVQYISPELEQCISKVNKQISIETQEEIKDNLQNKEQKQNQSDSFKISSSENELKTTLSSIFMARWREKNFF